jgi:hypothetical protein
MKIKALLSIKTVIIASLIFLSGCSSSSSCGGNANADGSLAVCSKSISF